ncbi:MAG TPA: trigger factor [Anaerolineaceae bacterium]
MNIETVIREDHQARIVVEFESDVLTTYIRKAARQIAERHRFPGFRPGKAPFDLVKRTVGENALREQAIEMMVDALYPDILKESGVKPGAPGKLDEIISQEPPKLAFLVPLAPEVVLGDYHTIKKEYNPIPVTDDDVEKEIHRMRVSYATAEPSDQPAQKGDRVSIKLSGTLTQPAEGENPEAFREDSYQITIGENGEDGNSEWPFKGFESLLVGHQAGDTFTLTHTFSEENDAERLKGKEVEFKVVVESVHRLVLPEPNDDFANTIREKQTYEELVNATRSRLERQKKNEYDDKYYSELIDEIKAISTIKYPPTMVEEEIEESLHNLQHSLEDQGMELDMYLKWRQLDRETFIEKEVRPAAISKLERSLLMEEFARIEGLQINQEELEKTYTSLLAQIRDIPGQKRSSQEQSQLASQYAMTTVYRDLNRRIEARLREIVSPAPLSEPETAEPETGETEAPIEVTESAPASEPNVSESSEMTPDTTAQEETPAS